MTDCVVPILALADLGLGVQVANELIQRKILLTPARVSVFGPRRFFVTETPPQDPQLAATRRVRLGMDHLQPTTARMRVDQQLRIGHTLLRQIG